MLSNTQTEIVGDNIVITNMPPETPCIGVRAFYQFYPEPMVEITARDENGRPFMPVPTEPGMHFYRCETFVKHSEFSDPATVLIPSTPQP